MPSVHRPTTTSPSFPTPTPSAYIIIPHGIPPTPSPIIHHHHTPAPTPSTPTPTAPSKDAVQVPPVGHTQPPQVSLETLLQSEAWVSHRVPRGCREEGRQRAPDRVCAGEWCRGSTVPCLRPLSLLEGGLHCTGCQPLTRGIWTGLAPGSVRAGVI